MAGDETAAAISPAADQAGEKRDPLAARLAIAQRAGDDPAHARHPSGREQVHRRGEPDEGAAQNSGQHEAACLP